MPQQLLLDVDHPVQALLRVVVQRCVDALVVQVPESNRVARDRRVVPRAGVLLQRDLLEAQVLGAFGRVRTRQLLSQHYVRRVLCESLRPDQVLVAGRQRLLDFAQRHAQRLVVLRQLRQPRPQLPVLGRHHADVLRELELLSRQLAHLLPQDLQLAVAHAAAPRALGVRCVGAVLRSQLRVLLLDARQALLQCQAALLHRLQRDVQRIVRREIVFRRRRQSIALIGTHFRRRLVSLSSRLFTLTQTQIRVLFLL